MMDRRQQGSYHGRVQRRWGLISTIALAMTFHLTSIPAATEAFVPTVSTAAQRPATLSHFFKPTGSIPTTPFHTASVSQSSSSPLAAKTEEGDDNEAQRLMDQVAKIRAQIAELEGKTVDEVTNEATQRKQEEKARLEESERKIKQSAPLSTKQQQQQQKQRSNDGRFLYVPANAEEQIRQATAAIERAFQDGKNRQTVRLALVREGKSTMEEEEWPGGAREMYREAGRPLTEALLREIRAQPPPPPAVETSTKKEGGNNDNDQENEVKLNKMLPPEVTAQDIWDFDGSALVKAKAAGGSSADVCAMVFPNTDVKYLNDIKNINEQMGQRLFLLVNPFWRNVDSWGFNILAPNAKKKAQEIVFDDEGKFEETYVMLQFSARGERCVALKVYPYDWQLYAYLEDESSSYGGNIVEEAVRLGSSKEEPTSAQFTELLNERPEFKMSRNMRQINRMM